MTDRDMAAVDGQSPRWDLYRYFLAVVKTSSISGAAQVLRESPPTVSRRIRELEAHFSEVLFRRSPGRLVLTAKGEKLKSRLERVDQEMAALHQEFSGGQTKLAGTVTITAPRGFGKAVLLDCLGELRGEMPDVEFSAVFGSRRLNLRHREADIAIRLGAQMDENMTRERIGTVTFGLFASSDYLNRKGVPSSLEDLEPADCIGLDDGAELPQVAELRSLSPGYRPGISVDCILLQAQTVSLGYGFAPLPLYMAKSYPNLVEILPNTLQNTIDAWALSQPDLNRSACVKAVLPRLASACASALEAN
ncbi:MAG: LysR family transcriptional regulator [Pseudomonadota bacterium]